MAKQKTIFMCAQCGHEVGRWLGRCPGCKAFNSFEEMQAEAKKGAAIAARAPRVSAAPTHITQVVSLEDGKTPTGITELDRVLSGGIVGGSLILVGGEPGIGKSTLLLQICKEMRINEPILYISGEESLAQIKLRADRLKCAAHNLSLLAETDLGNISRAIDQTAPGLVIIDSIQTMLNEDHSSAPGSIVQVRECTSFFMRLAKAQGISVIIVGHVTKEGSIAGPRILEHMVDAVLYFEGERQANYRLIRAVKNRFGATDEIGVFEMQEQGLVGIANPSEYMLTGRPIDAPGSVVTCTVEGSRPILTEVQALAAKTNFGHPRRVANGIDYNRMNMLLAMLEKRGGFNLAETDVYVNIAGGMRISEPALDLAAVAAIASSCLNKPVKPNVLIFGEAGLTGEARAVTGVQARIAEGAKLGFAEAIVPQGNLKGLKAPDGIRVFGVSNIGEMIRLMFS